MNRDLVTKAVFALVAQGVVFSAQNHNHAAILPVLLAETVEVAP
jgi:hypothetical protein